jgi:hypothetical protein
MQCGAAYERTAGACIAAVSVSALLLLASSAAAFAQTNSGGATKVETPIGFEIAAQPLAPALDAYSAATGLEVLYDSNLANGRLSTSVSGVLVPDVALRVLLEGTGLTAFYTENAFAIVPAPPGAQQPHGMVPSEHLPYLAIVQAAIESAFCRQAETVPGHYRLALQFRIGTSGEVLYPQLLSSTGDRERDRTITELLRNLRIEQGPPPGMRQPLTMLVSPRPPSQSGDCRVGQSSPASAAR